MGWVSLPTVYAPEAVHQRLLDTAEPELSFNEGVDLDAWREALATRLRDALGVMPALVPLDMRVEWQRKHDGYQETRFVFTAEPDVDVPCHLLVPSTAHGPVPVMVCLQGHTAGMHVSLARADSSSSMESVPVEGDRDFAVQVVARGWAALTVEQRCFGERADARPAERRTVHSTCHHATHVAGLLGRTMVGERVWDVRRALDALAAFPDLDLARVGCMGNSGGGTVSWYAACLEPRITAVMPSCAVCTYRASIGSVDHCCDNYLPGALRYFDMPDLAGLIAPRPLVVVAGREDDLFPFTGVRDAFAAIQRIYAATGATDQCALVVGKGGHRFYAGAAWPVFEELSGWPAGPVAGAASRHGVALPAARTRRAQPPTRRSR